LTKIMADRLIKPATLYVPEGEKPVVWFSSNQLWEQTANKGYLDGLGQHHPCTTMQETYKLDGCARLGVAREVAPYSWNDFKRLSGVSPRMAKGLYRAALKCGARSGEWFVSFEPVPVERWLAIEAFDGSSWIPFKDQLVTNAGVAVVASRGTGQTSAVQAGALRDGIGYTEIPGRSQRPS
jgi:hypothetical protein